MTRQTHQIQMTYVNTETEDFSAKELNGILQLLLIFFRRLTMYTKDTEFWLANMN